MKTSTLMDKTRTYLKEGAIVTIGTSKRQYVVFYDDGTATEQPPYWRFKSIGDNSGIIPSAIKNYPHSVKLYKEDTK